MARQDYGKAIKILETCQHDFEADFMLINIFSNKYGDYEKALKVLQTNYGMNFCSAWNKGLPTFEIVRPEVGGTERSLPKNGRKPARSSRALADDILYLAAKCYEGLGNHAKAYIEYGRFLQYPDYVIHQDNALDAKMRMEYLEKILKEKAKPMWKVGDWWEGTQGWHLSSPENKNMAEGWVFTDMYFEVSGIEKYGPFESYTLDIYHYTRSDLLALCKDKPQDKNKFRFVTYYISTLTNTPCGILPGKAWRIQPTYCILEYMPYPYIAHGMLIYYGYYTLVPLVENKHLPPLSFMFFTEPFQAEMPNRFYNSMKYSDTTVMVNQKELACRQSLITWDINYEIMSSFEIDPNLIDFISKAVKSYDFPQYKSAKTVDIATPHREQNWNDRYRWWVRDVEFNPWYVEGKSPADAKFSKLFVITCHNGEKLSVDTGLSGKFSDINVLRASYKDFDDKCPYDAYPSRETAQLLNLYFNNSLSSVKMGKECIRRGKMALAYAKEQNNRAFAMAIEIYLSMGDRYFRTPLPNNTKVKKYPEDEPLDRAPALSPK
jgi:hypothetical protein